MAPLFSIDHNNFCDIIDIVFFNRLWIPFQFLGLTINVLEELEALNELGYWQTKVVVKRKNWFSRRKWKVPELWVKYLCKIDLAFAFSSKEDRELDLKEIMSKQC